MLGCDSGAGVGLGRVLEGFQPGMVANWLPAAYQPGGLVRWMTGLVIGLEASISDFCPCGY
jgi:hypothetical protein